MWMYITHCGAAWYDLSHVISLAEYWNVKRNNLIYRHLKWTVASFHNPNTSNTFSHIWSGCGPCGLLYHRSIYIMTWTNWPTKPSGDLSITFSRFCLVSAFLCIKSVLIGICRRVNHHHDSSDQSECWLALSGREGFLVHNFVGVILSQRCNDMAQHNQPGKEHCALGPNRSNDFYCFMIKGNARKKIRYTEFIWLAFTLQKLFAGV